MAIQEYIQYFDDETVSNNLVAVDIELYQLSAGETLVPFPRNKYPDRRPGDYQRDPITDKLTKIPDQPIGPSIDLEALKKDIEDDARLSAIVKMQIIKLEPDIRSVMHDTPKMQYFWGAMKQDTDAFKWLTPRNAAIIENLAAARGLHLSPEPADISTVPDIDEFARLVLAHHDTVSKYLLIMGDAISKLREYLTNPDAIPLIKPFWIHLKTAYNLPASYTDFVESIARNNNIPIV